MKNYVYLVLRIMYCIYSCHFTASYQHLPVCMHNAQPPFLILLALLISFLILREATFLWNCSNKSRNVQYFSKSTHYFSINFDATEQPSWGNNGPIHRESLLWLIASSQLCHQIMYGIYSFQHQCCIFYALCSSPWYHTVSHQYLQLTSLN